MKKFLRGYGLLFLISGLIILADQVTKSMVRQNIPFGETWSPWPWLAPYARVVHWYNTGVAFGMFQGKGDIFLVLAIIVAIAIIYYYPRVPASDWTLRIAMGLQLGGAVGNLIDRIFQGHVTDFISVGTFAVFNIADASITVGVAVLLLGVYIQEQRSKNQPSTPDSETGPAKNDDQAAQE